jgi:hypothetical protein
MCHTHTVSILWEFCFLHVKCHDGVTENDVQFARSIFAVFLSCYLLYKVTANVSCKHSLYLHQTPIKLAYSAFTLLWIKCWGREQESIWVQWSPLFYGQCIFITNKVTSITINKPFKYQETALMVFLNLAVCLESNLLGLWCSTPLSTIY